MQNIIPQEFYEYLAILFSVLIGTACYIGFVSGIKERMKITWKKGTSVLFVNLFLTNLASNILLYFDKGELRSILLPAVSLLGVYIMEYIDKRYIKLFDAGVRKVGLKIDDTDDEEINNNMNYEENIEQEDNSDIKGDPE